MKLSKFYSLIGLTTLILCGVLSLIIKHETRGFLDGDSLFLITIFAPIIVVLLVYLYRNAPPKKK